MSVSVDATVTITIGDVTATITADEAKSLRDALLDKFPVHRPVTYPPNIGRPLPTHPLPIFPDIGDEPRRPKYPNNPREIWCGGSGRVTVHMESPSKD